MGTHWTVRVGAVRPVWAEGVGAVGGGERRQQGPCGVEGGGGGGEWRQ